MNDDSILQAPRETVLMMPVQPTLRDQFAMAVVTGLLPDFEWFESADRTRLATLAYDIADRMLAARDRGR